MRSFTMELRGISVEVRIHRDYGYDSSTNSHDVDWSIEPYPELPLTQEEEERIQEEVYIYLNEYDPY